MQINTTKNVAAKKDEERRMGPHIFAPLPCCTRHVAVAVASARGVSIGAAFRASIRAVTGWCSCRKLTPRSIPV